MSARPARIPILLAIATLALAPTRVSAQWAGYERMTVDSLEAALAKPSPQPIQLTGKNLSDLDLRAFDFRGANLSSSVFNDAKLMHAKLGGTNLTVSFFERADLSAASLTGAMMFSVQMNGSILRHANLARARLIGNLRRADLSGAILTHVNAAADMRNQSMGLMNAVLANTKAVGADLSDSDFSRADLSFADFSGARMRRTQLIRADLSGANLTGADLSQANLRDAQVIDTDFSKANLTGTDFTGATFRGVRGLDTAITQGARGLPPPAPRADQ